MEILRLKQLRLDIGKTQEELAKILDLPRVTYANYESGRREPDNNTLSKLADYFKVSVDYLLGRTNLKNYSEDILAFDSTEGLTQEDLDLVHQMIENLRKKNQGK